MIGPILLLVSWFLLRFEGRSLAAIGIDQPWLRSRQFFAGFLVTAIVASSQQLGTSWSAGVPFQPNPSANLPLILHHLRWNINSVLYEELLFRGYLLFQAVRRLGAWRGSLLGASAFGVYHWFSYGLLGNPVGMAYIFLLTGMFGLMLSVAFTWTGSVAAPIGLHLGWNLTSYLGFSAGPLGPGLLVPANGAAKLLPATALASIGLSFLVPLVMVASVVWFFRRRPPMVVRASSEAA